MVIIKWTNKFSNESGFVESVDTKAKHFNNTFEYNQAKKYKSDSVARGMISKLVSYGEGDNNDFEILTV
jgi:hypothetical protein